MYTRGSELLEVEILHLKKIQKTDDEQVIMSPPSQKGKSTHMAVMDQFSQEQ